MRRTSRPARRSFAFTLIEMLVVIAILGILMALLFPMTGDALEKGKRPTCMSNLKQIAMAYTSYATDHRDKYPQGMSDPKLPFGDMAPLGSGAFLGPMILWNEGYVPDPRLLYCPAARFFTFRSYWNSNNWSGTFTSYSFLAGYTNTSFGATNCQLWFAMGPDWPPDSMIAMDNCVYWQPEKSWQRSSHQRGALKGGHLLGNDGHVEWKDAGAMSNRFTEGGGDFYW